MTRLDKILTNFTDTELAYLYKYQVDTFMKPTQEKIVSYIFNTRGLTINSIDRLINDHSSITVPDCLEACPRCKSNKIHKHKIDWAIPLFEAGAEDELAMHHEIHTGKTYYKDKIVCSVCGFILEDPNAKKSFLKTIYDIIFDNPLWNILRK